VKRKSQDATRMSHIIKQISLDVLEPSCTFHEMCANKDIRVKNTLNIDHVKISPMNIQ
jgi:hypothetical protein